MRLGHGEPPKDERRSIPAMAVTVFAGGGDRERALTAGSSDAWLRTVAQRDAR